MTELDQLANMLRVKTLTVVGDCCKVAVHRGYLVQAPSLFECVSQRRLTQSA